MEQQASYDSWQRIKAVTLLDSLWGGAPRAFSVPAGGAFRGGGEGGGNEGQQKLAAPQHLASPTSLATLSFSALKNAAISSSGKQPKATATGESGLPDQIEEKPWSVYGSEAWPDPNTQYWRRGSAATPMCCPVVPPAPPVGKRYWPRRAAGQD